MEQAPERRGIRREHRGVSPETWARRLQQGDPKAVQEVRSRVNRIMAYGELKIRDQERADLVQEIVAELWQAVNRSRFDASGGFWGFVELVTSRRCIDWLRSRREAQPLDQEPLGRGKSPLGHALDREQATLASAALAALEPDCRKLIALRVRDGRSYREIAETLDKKEGALRVQFYRCVQHARRLMRTIVKDREGNGVGGGPDATS